MSLFHSILPNRGARNAAEDEKTFPSVKPRYEIQETGDAYGLTVHLPGVSRDSLEISAEDGRLRIVGRRTWRQPESWTSLYRETNDLPYELVLTHENDIDVDRIAAELRDGVLRVSLPRHESLKPRQIAVG